MGGALYSSALTCLQGTKRARKSTSSSVLEIGTTNAQRNIDKEKRKQLAEENRKLELEIRSREVQASTQIQMHIVTLLMKLNEKMN